MSRNDIKDVLQMSSGESITISGWVRTKRNSKGLVFIAVNDGSDFDNIQIVIDEKIANYDEVKSLTTGSAISVAGLLVDSPASGQRVEIQAESVEIYSVAPSDYPLQKKHHTLEFLRTVPHLRARTNTLGAVARVRSSASIAIHKFFVDRGFYLVNTPIITTSDCEGAGEMFAVQSGEGDFFGSPANLTVSGQLEGEAYALALGKIYTFGPTFRAENSHTTRHLSEFWMIEPEVAFARISDCMDLAESFVKYVVDDVVKSCPKEMEFFNSRVEPGLLEELDNLINSSFNRVSYTEAISILENCGVEFSYRVKWGDDLQTEHERYLTEKHFSGPVIVYNYPRELKPFYMLCNDDEKTVSAMDLLVPRIGELIGGSEREWREDLLQQRMLECSVSPDDYSWYMDLRRYGSVPHAGFGLGFERLILLLTGIKNIRDAIPFPRYPGSATR